MASLGFGRKVAQLIDNQLGFAVRCKADLQGYLLLPVNRGLKRLIAAVK